MAPGSAANLLMSAAWLYLAPVGEANPDDTTVDFGDAWGGNWDWLGWTSEPLSENYDVQVVTAEVQQESSPVLEAISTETMSLTTTLAENTPENRQILHGGTITTTAAGAAQRGVTLLEAGGRSGPLPRYKVGFEGVHQTAAGLRFPVRYYYHICTLRQNGATVYGKNVVAGIPIQISVYADPTKDVNERLYIMEKITAEITA